MSNFLQLLNRFSRIYGLEYPKFKTEIPDMKSIYTFPLTSLIVALNPSPGTSGITRGYNTGLHSNLFCFSRSPLALGPGGSTIISGPRYGEV
jgi:hypothetical protein